MTRRPTLRAMLREAGDRMWHELNEDLVPHGGEKGEAREEVLRAFLTRHLPRRVGVSKGFVFDRSGDVSRQIDLVVYDRLFSPRFEVAGGKRFFPAEAVVCVGEVKSTLGSKRDLADGLAKVLSVKQLNRGAKGENIAVPSGSPMDQRSNHLDQIFGFVFGVHSEVTPDFVRDILAESISEEERHLWPNLVFALDRFVVTFACEHGICPNPMDAKAIGVVEGVPRERLLLEWFQRIAMAVQVTRVGAFEYAEHLGRGALNAGTVYFFGSVPREERESLAESFANSPSTERESDA